MHCPSCKQGGLKSDFLEDSLPCHTCNYCGGNWLLLSDYSDWVSKTDLSSTENDEESGQDMELINDSKQLLICPQSNTLMIKYRISKDHQFQLDFSEAVNGIWLDKGEWVAIKDAGLSQKLKKIISASWQKEIRSQYVNDQLEMRYRRGLSEDAYQRVAEFREWINSHGQADLLRAYINRI